MPGLEGDSHGWAWTEGSGDDAYRGLDGMGNVLTRRGANRGTCEPRMAPPVPSPSLVSGLGKPRVVVMTLTKLYDRFNKEWFNGELPACRPRFVKLKTAGLWVQYEDGTFDVFVNEKLRFAQFAVCITLLHEMIHVKCSLRDWDDHAEHGKKFLKVRARLLRKGAFDEWI